ncbi:hypothetical protein TL18_00795 [Methanobrevibacter sp. YE315]|uniref:Ig-like domain-containing protein n=1 Tax=Methanobrevibacter sp. YE315 TaxID=1609968 RepID=UPI000764E5EE|nr:Ig-like domain-containing protein [Methanobrevibacter sp. YE315]AMD16703.1 hypothetical protein TL18_00795 [Methanobrevibacter sp. YE315]
MKFDKLLIAGLFLLAILTMGAANAADNNITDASDDVLSVDALDTDGLEASPGDFDELQSLVDNTESGKTLKLQKDYSNDKQDSVVRITKSITIDGQGHTIDGKKSLTNIFYITTIQKVTLKNIKFVDNKNTTVVGYGNSYKCTVDNCSFVGCSISCNEYGVNAYGGAIAYGNAYNSTFIECTSWTVGATAYGGAIYKGSAYNCSFVDCSAVGRFNYGYGYGGAICEGSAYNCSFEDCFASCDREYAYGGAIYHGDAYNCSFVDCSATIGGAIYNGSAHDCSFLDCSASGGYESFGGAIQHGSAYNCSFVNCFASANFGAYGGAIRSGGAYNCSFVNCSASNGFYNRGGAISGGSAYNCSFADCYATNAGGAIYNGNAKDSIFRNCSSKDSNAAICKGTDTNCTFIECQALAAINSIRTRDVNYGESAYVFVDGEASAGYVNITVNGKTKKVKPESSVYFSDLSSGTYEVRATYQGSNDYKAQNVTTTLKVNKVDSIRSISVKREKYIHNNDKIQFSYNQSRLYVYLRNTAVPGSITVKINNLTYIRNTTGHSEMSFSLGIMKPGTYDIKVIYDENVNHKAQNETLNFEVVKAKPISYLYLSPYDYYSFDNFSRQINYDAKDTSLDIYLNSDRIVGNAHVTVNGASHKAFAIKGKSEILNIPLGILNVGENVIKVTYGGSAYFDAQEVSFNINMLKATPIASVEVSNCAVGSDPTIKVKVNNVNGNIWFTVSDENGNNILTDKIHIENGLAIASVSSLASGKYRLHIYYAGTARYNAQTIKTNFEVTKISPELSVSKATVDGKTVLTANLAEDAPGNVKFEVNGSTYKAKITKGVATRTLPDLAPGTYTLKTSYAGNYKYLAETKTRSITIK